MLVEDLGELRGPVVVFGGPYSNLAATRAVLAAGAGCALICTGDVVAYCAEAAETVALVRASGASVVAGNCERQLAAGEMDCGCGFEDGSACDLLSAGWYAHADRAVGASDRRWMAGLPDMVRFTHAGQRYAVIHGGTQEIARFIWSCSPEAVFAQEGAMITALSGPVDVVIAGHSGIAFQRDVAGLRWINAGVIGMPPNDGQTCTQYVRLEDGAAQICTLSYNAEAAAAAMEKAGLVQGYHRALRDGWWPSEDVLPDQLRRRARASG